MVKKSEASQGERAVHLAFSEEIVSQNVDSVPFDKINSKEEVDISSQQKHEECKI